MILTAKKISVDEYKRLPYERVIVPDPSGGYFGTVIELDGCMTEGETVEETASNLEEAMQGWLETSLSHNLDIPEPLALRDYSGQFNVRIPKSLHRDLVRTALKEDVSLNALVNSLLERGLNGKKPRARSRR